MGKKIPPNKSKEGIYKSNNSNFGHENFMSAENIGSGDDSKSSLSHQNNFDNNKYDEYRKPDLSNFSIEDCDPGLAADIAKDIENLNSNPKVAVVSDQLFDKVYKKAKKESDKNPYKTASQRQIDFIEEFSKSEFSKGEFGQD
jgi:hypothetical protein